MNGGSLDNRGNLVIEKRPLLNYNRAISRVLSYKTLFAIYYINLRFIFDSKKARAMILYSLSSRTNHLFKYLND